MLLRSFAILVLLLGYGTYLTADPLYSVTDIGPFLGNSLNDSGQVLAGGFLYSNGQLISVSQLTGRVGIGAISINNAGQIAGVLTGPGHYLSIPFIYSNGQVQTFGSSVYGRAYGINDLGQVTGYSGADLLPGDLAFLYSEGQFKELGTLGEAFTNSMGLGINNAGQVVGFSGTNAGFTHAFLYSNGQMTDLGNLGTGLFVSRANAINNVGQITGFSQSATAGQRAFLYADGQMRALGTITGSVYEDSEGLGINDAGQIVGSATGPFNFHQAFLYSQGQMLNLNSLIDPALNLTLNEAIAINNQGQILANTLDSSTLTVHAYLLTPVPEPSTWALLSLAFGLAACLRFKIIQGK